MTLSKKALKNIVEKDKKAGNQHSPLLPHLQLSTAGIFQAFSDVCHLKNLNALPSIEQSSPIAQSVADRT